MRSNDTRFVLQNELGLLNLVRYPSFKFGELRVENVETRGGASSWSLRLAPAHQKWSGRRKSPSGIKGKAPGGDYG